MSLSDDGVDKIDFQPDPLEEEVTACSIAVALYIELRQVWLCHNTQHFCIKDEMDIDVTCTMLSNSLLSFASSLRISSSTVFA